MNIYFIWAEFIDNYKEYFQSNEEIWLQNFDKINKYIETNHKLPSKTDIHP